MPETPQTLSNHVRFFPPFHFFAIPVLLLNFLYSVWLLWSSPSLATAFGVLVAAALVTLGLSARTMALAVQDRVIRLEMQLRLHEVLPADLRNRVSELTRGQMVALRFAGNAEMADLVRDILAGRLTTAKSIKERVKDWQGDFLRA